MRVCPRCLSENDESLWKEVIGWQDYEDSSFSRVHDVVETDNIGCSCGWEGFDDELLRLGNDGRPLIKQPPEQAKLDI